MWQLGSGQQRPQRERRPGHEGLNSLLKNLNLVSTLLWDSLWHMPLKMLKKIPICLYKDCACCQGLEEADWRKKALAFPTLPKVSKPFAPDLVRPVAGLAVTVATGRHMQIFIPHFPPGMCMRWAHARSIDEQIVGSLIFPHHIAEVLLEE